MEEAAESEAVAEAVEHHRLRKGRRLRRCRSLTVTFSPGEGRDFGPNRRRVRFGFGQVCSETLASQCTMNLNIGQDTRAMYMYANSTWLSSSHVCAHNCVFTLLPLLQDD